MSDVHNSTYTILRVEQDSISKQFKSNPKNCAIKSTLK